MQPEQKKNSCSTYHSFNLFFSITTYHFLTTDSKLAIARAKCLPYLLVFLSSFHSYALHLYPYRNYVKEILGNFKNPVGVVSVVLKKIDSFLKFQNGSINLLGIASEEILFIISQIMLVKHVYMGQKFQRTLKLSMSFSLKHIFISAEILTQVASAPLSHFSSHNLLFL